MASYKLRSHYSPRSLFVARRKMKHIIKYISQMRKNLRIYGVPSGLERAEFHVAYLVTFCYMNFAQL